MKFDNFKQSNCSIGENQKEYKTIPAYKVKYLFKPNEGEYITLFRFTRWERIKLLFSNKLWMHFLTFNNDFQPIKIQMKNPFSKSNFGVQIESF